MMSKTFFLDGRMTAHLAWQIFTSREACLTQLADDLGRLLRAAQQEQDMVSLLLPGGSSPAALLPLLAEQELDWRALRISPTDERWVAADAPQSNWRLLYSGLPQAFVLDPRQAEHIEQAAQNWGEQVASWAPFSAVLLGMGEDGHVASLFPPLDDQTACGEAAGYRAAGIINLGDRIGPGFSDVDPRSVLRPDDGDLLPLLGFGGRGYCYRMPDSARFQIDHRERSIGKVRGHRHIALRPDGQP